jgi:glycosyltransferase involved in cell wall biosynthesis
VRIAIISLNLKWVAGGQRLTYELAQAMKRKGHDIVIYVPDTEYSETVYPDLQKGLAFRKVRVPRGYVWSPRSKSTFRRILYKIEKEHWLNSVAKRVARALLDDGDRFDIVHPHDNAYKVAYYYRKMGGRAHVIGENNDPVYAYLPHRESYVYDRLSRFFNWAKNFVERKYFRALEATAVLDLYNKQWFESRGVPHAEVAHHGTDFARFYAPVKDNAEKFRQKKVRLMSIGTLEPYRGYAQLIEIVHLLRDQGYDATAVIVGDDFWKKAEWREPLTSRIAMWHLEPYVTIYFESVSNDELKKMYAESDIFAYLIYNPPPRNGFGFSSSIPEAAASGIPSITWTTTTSLEAFKDGESIMAAPPLRADLLAEKVKFLVDHPDAYRAMAIAAQNIVKSELTWDKYMDRISALFLKFAKE